MNMTSIKNFEDLIAGQKTGELTGNVYELAARISFLVILDCVTKFNVRQVPLCIILLKGFNQAPIRSL